MTASTDDALYHLATPAEWAAYQAAGEIVPASLESEGFIHCSYGSQIEGTLGRHFAGVPEVLALEIDPAQVVGVELKVEEAPSSGLSFPHFYGPIPVAAVLGVEQVQPRP